MTSTTTANKNNNDPHHKNIKTVSIRLLESFIIGSVIMFGVVKVMQTQMEIITNNQHAIVVELKETREEQARRTVIVQESWKHITDNNIHR